ncbi:alpha/beta fold hydrolase [Ktedonospora formicarum]|uniref:2-hydroxy-6-oxo-6-phenylhexa-2,4-dienoate hydrolase n=1 Tax=Ktedonospora formicarum TaxID=2778364 RepID=A0A8J3I736_9CHLR|nr:alpha/beta hydrolase [Ktedonospora formicarum]GHO48060.1 2-hydroxy-6-oxo-6-phenylhexa-2,4-dienoate hydrolase [Ktedonospora formicarum]
MECLVRDIPVYYETYGSGTPILAIHGFTPDHRLMTGCMEPLFAGRPGWQRIYLDLPGMGRTPGAEHLKSSDDMLAVVLDFIDAIIPEQRFLLAGESYGGYLSQGVLTRKFEQVAGMALICPAVIADHARRDLPPHTTIVANPEFLATLSPEDTEEFAPMAVVQDEYNWQRFRDEIRPGLRVADQAFLQKIQQSYRFSFEVNQLPQPFAKPVLIFTGRQDASVGYRDAWGILENYPRGTFAVLDRAGHNGHIEQSQLFNALMGEWLDRVEEAL